MTASTLEVVDLDLDLKAVPVCEIVKRDETVCTLPAAWLLSASCGHRLLCCQPHREMREARNALVQCSTHGVAPVEITWIPL